MKVLMGIVLLMTTIVAFLAYPVQGKPKYLESSHKAALTLEFGTHYCSGTAISANVILSAGHCFLSDEAISFKVDGRDAKVTKIIRDGKDHVLVMVNIAFSDYARFGSQKLTQGDEVYYFGNPGMKDIYRSGQYVGEEDGNAVFDVNAWQGDSGAGVFNDKGQLVAVINALAKVDIFKLTFCFPLTFTDEQYKSLGVK